MKKLIALFISLLILVGLSVPVLAQGEVKAEFDVNLQAFIDIDSFSTLNVDPPNNEAGLRSDVIVRVLDRNGTPLEGHSIHLYIEATDGTVLFVQPSDTDSDGYAIGKVRSMTEGAYVIRAYDSTYGQNIVISDSDTFYVFPVATPQLDSEPHYTKGNSNKLSWQEVSGSDTYQYYLQAATDSHFNSVVANSGWVSSSAYQFNNLDGGQIYFYRVKARNSGEAESGWSNSQFSVQDDQAPVIKVNDISFTKNGKNISGVVINLAVTDDLALDSVELFCKRENGDLDSCGVLEHDGSHYTASIPLSDLEQGILSGLFDNYTFCVVAKDEAGNSSKNCEAQISTVEEGSEPEKPTGPSVVVTIINNTVDKINRTIKRIDIDLTGFLDGTQAWILELLSLMIILLVVIIAVAVLTGSFVLVPAYLTHLIFKALKFVGVKPHGTPGGLIYDVVSKNPVKWALIEIFDGNNNLVWRDFTDETGEFMVNLEPGKYRIAVRTPRYLFPSQLVKTREDRKLGKIYKGEYFMITKKEPLSVAIPMDPVNMRVDVDVNFWEVKKPGLLKSLNILFLVVGLGLAGYLVGKGPNLLNIIVLLTYIPAVFLYLRGIFKFNLRAE